MNTEPGSKLESTHEPGDTPPLQGWRLAALIALVLLAVVAGTFFTMRFEAPRPVGSPTMLGHDPVPPPRLPTPPAQPPPPPQPAHPR